MYAVLRAALLVLFLVSGAESLKIRTPEPQVVVPAKGGQPAAPVPVKR